MLKWIPPPPSNNMNKAVTLLSAAFLTGQAIAQAPTTALLRLKPRTDKPYYYATTIKASGGSMDVKMNMTAKYDFTPAGEDRYQLKMSVTDFTSDGMPGGALDSIKGSVIEMDLSNKAEVLSMTGEGMLKTMIS